MTGFSRAKVSMADFSGQLKKLNEYLKKKGLRHTQQREEILKVFLQQQHVTTEDLWALVKKRDSSVGYATVYRTLKLFVDVGIALKHEFGEGSARYEPSGGDHHDHLICTECGLIVEFENDKIESLQDQVAAEHTFKLTHHKMELYGLCPQCQ